MRCAGRETWLNFTRSSQRQRRADGCLICDVKLNMRCTERLQAFAHNALREFRFVAVATQVAEVEMAQIGRNDFLNAIGSGFVGEMAVTAEDALLQTPRTMRTILQHFYIVIGFKDERVRGANALEHKLGDVPEVGGKADVAAGRVQDEASRVLRVMRD